MARKSDDIEDVLIWAYRDQCADAAIDRAMAGMRPSGYRSVQDTLNRQAMLGTRIDSGGMYAAALSDVDPVAEQVVDTMNRVAGDVRSILVRHAKTGMRPSDGWLDIQWSIKPKWRLRKGMREPRYIYTNRQCTRKLYAPLVISPDPADLLYQQKMYEFWWQALVYVRDCLGDWVTGPVAPRDPWDGWKPCLTPVDRYTDGFHADG